MGRSFSWVFLESSEALYQYPDSSSQITGVRSFPSQLFLRSPRPGSIAGRMPYLRHVPPMGIYETLYAFRDAFGKYMGDPGTHPWNQSFPRTVQLPVGPTILTSVNVTSDHLKHPKAWGMTALRERWPPATHRNYGTAIAYE